LRSTSRTPHPRGAVKAHAAALHQLGELLATAPEPLRQQVCSQRKTLKAASPSAPGCVRSRPPGRPDTGSQAGPAGHPLITSVDRCQEPLHRRIRHVQRYHNHGVGWAVAWLPSVGGGTHAGRCPRGCEGGGQVRVWGSLEPARQASPSRRRRPGPLFPAIGTSLPGVGRGPAAHLQSPNPMVEGGSDGSGTASRRTPLDRQHRTRLWACLGRQRRPRGLLHHGPGVDPGGTADASRAAAGHRDRDAGDVGDTNHRLQPAGGARRSPPGTRGLV
jgi:hypothetical protein